MGIKDYFSGIFNISEEEEFEGETFEETPKDNDIDSDSKRSAAKKFSSSRKQSAEGGSAMRMVLVRPEIFSDVAPIADHLKQGKTVVLNLENAEAPAARRIVDFLSGSAYALSFKFKPVSNNTFVIIPDNTDFSGDLLLDDYGSENYFL
ncbi:MAG: cell division protein SepF [Clostridia bacterium]|nr:cell division protein SepF [Clostridia bacterium]